MGDTIEDSWSCRPFLRVRMSPKITFTATSVWKSLYCLNWMFVTWEEDLKGRWIKWSSLEKWTWNSKKWSFRAKSAFSDESQLQMNRFYNMTASHVDQKGMLIDIFLTLLTLFTGVIALKMQKRVVFGLFETQTNWLTNSFVKSWSPEGLREIPPSLASKRDQVLAFRNTGRFCRGTEFRILASALAVLQNFQ